MKICVFFALCLFLVFSGAAQGQIIYESDFSSGTDGWPSDANESTSSGDPFLGRPKPYETLTQTFTILDVSKPIKIEFDFLEIDSWDGDVGDSFGVSIDGNQIFDLSFVHKGRKGGTGNDPARNGVTGNVTWSVSPLTDNDIHLGFGKWEDQIHRVSLLVANPNSTLELALHANHNHANEGVGIDNIIIFYDLLPIVTAKKTVSSSSYILPGLEVVYTIDITSSGAAIDSNTIVISDKIPAEVALFTGDFDGLGNAVKFIDNSSPVSGLSCCSAINIAYSDDLTGVPVYDYIPASDYDSNVRHLKITVDGVAREGNVTPVNVELSFKTEVL